MIDTHHPLILGSASPRRRALLADLGIPVCVAPKAIDETPLAGEEAHAYLVRVTLAKLAAVGAAVDPSEAGGVLVADTSVVCDGAILGKPSDEAEARAMIRSLSGRAHEVWTRFAVARPEAPTTSAHEETVRTRVTFRALDDDEIAGYAATGEGLDKAGAYAIQGIGAFAALRIEGSYANVVGLPVCEVVVALRKTGLLARLPAFARAT